MKDTSAYDVVPTTVAATVAARAVATVGRHALDDADRRELLAALGLPDDEGQAHVVEQAERAAGYRALARAVVTGEPDD